MLKGFFRLNFSILMIRGIPSRGVPPEAEDGGNGMLLTRLNRDEKTMNIVFETVFNQGKYIWKLPVELFISPRLLDKGILKKMENILSLFSGWK